ncbi:MULTISPECIES: DUF2304 domain-containing protein [Coprobacillaceae]|mgnify:CR=1 FL=1|uniref:DUF2304 domain-containing protein n=1 Tax=Coprobacillaceae TaxID=2810280 RepID=UPI000E4BE87D|nr:MULTISPECIES: DUF2304 domain-containing protein [Coprobacillaceae]RHM59396.1 DUF2304 domain-containing protein [Coprobacillus sp. AF33-1AC]RHS91757.1 DUF2304 domain-containing protein [Erysipelatoclostridium sp. AM42-17]
MTLTLQIILIITSIITFIFVINKIRKSQLDIQDSVIWILLSILLIIMSLFLPFIDRIARSLGFISTSNFVFALIMFFLLIIVFTQTVKISILNEKIKNLNHYIALEEKKNKK